MRNVLFIFILNLLGTVLNSQQIHFSRNYPVLTGSDYTGGVVQKADSGFVFVSNVQQPGFVGFTFTNTDKFGDTTFTKKYPFTTIAFSLVGAHSLIIDSNGDYIQCGSGIDTSNNRQGYIVKFDGNGDTLWTKNYGGAGIDILNSIFQDSDSNLWAVGSTNSAGNGQLDFWMLNLDQNGNVLLDTTYGTAASEALMCGDFTLDGGFILSGKQGSYPYIIKLDSLCAVDWASNYPGYFSYGFITQLPDSHFVLACNRPVGQDELGCLLNLDTAGAISWYSYVGFPLCTNTVYTKPLKCNDGFAVAGISLPDSTMTVVAFLSKTDLTGNLLWQRTYTLNVNNDHYIYDFQATSDNGFILAGSCYITTQDAWLLKVDSLGCEVAGCDGVGIAEQKELGSLSVYPNPAIGSATISFAEEVASDAYVEILNSSGQMVDRMYTNGMNSVSFSTETYAEGIYCLRLVRNSELIETKKLIIVR